MERTISNLPSRGKGIVIGLAIAILPQEHITVDRKPIIMFKKINFKSPIVHLWMPFGS